MEICENGCKVIIDNIEDIIFYKQKLYQSIINLKDELKEKQRVNQSVINLKEELKELKEKQEALHNVEKYLYVNCNHQWVTDSIDSIKNYKLGQIIKYCEICELSGYK